MMRGPPREGASALFVAAGEGHESAVRRLLQLGARPNLGNRHGATPLSHAAVRGHVEIARALLAAAADPSMGPGNSTALHSALRGSARARSLTKLVKLLLGARVDADAADDAGASALHLAASRGASGAVSALLSAGAAVEGAPRDSRVTPLMAAAAAGHTDSVKRLILAGAEVDAVASAAMHGVTAVYFAAQGGHADATAALLDGGSQVAMGMPMPCGRGHVRVAMGMSVRPWAAPVTHRWTPR